MLMQEGVLRLSLPGLSFAGGTINSVNAYFVIFCSPVKQFFCREDMYVRMARKYAPKHSYLSNCFSQQFLDHFTGQSMIEKQLLFTTSV